ncbi:DedA family protein [Patescibacteria group bacterium]|nr:DedA family protein [Patescibacteria group bacterium]
MLGISHFTDFIIHLDDYLLLIVNDYGFLTYLILWLIIFCETGLVLTPFLPGDSLLFVVGTLAAMGLLKVGLLFGLLFLAAVVGDTVNYWLGHFIGPKIFNKEDSRLFNKKYLERAFRFYQKYGGQTIVLARFVPFLRTFVPFVAGMARMNYWLFIVYNILGGFLWVGIFIFGGYFFGNLPFVKDNFTLFILGIIFVTLIPPVFRLIKKPKRSE